MSVINLTKPVFLLSRGFGLFPYKIPSSNDPSYRISFHWYVYSVVCFSLGVLGHIYMCYSWLPEFYQITDVSRIFLNAIDKAFEIVSFMIDMPAVLFATKKIPQVLNRLIDLQHEVIVSSAEYRYAIRLTWWMLILSVTLVIVICITIEFEGTFEFKTIICDFAVFYNGFVLTCINHQFLTLVNIISVFYIGVNCRMKRSAFTIEKIKKILAVDDILKDVVHNIYKVFGITNLIFSVVSMVQMLYHMRRLVFEHQDCYTIFVFFLWILYYGGFMITLVSASNFAHCKVKYRNKIVLLFRTKDS